MPSGLQGKSVPTANTWTLLYTIPSSKVLSASINAVYTGTSATGTYVDIAASTSATSGGIVASEYIEWNVPLASIGSAFERTGLVLDATNAPYIWVRSSAGSTSFQAYGYEE